MTASLCMVIRCDKKGCRESFTCDPGQYKDGWTAARDLGWTYWKDYDENNIGKNAHSCPKHGKKRRERRTASS